jgi:hypothetical protein
MKVDVTRQDKIITSKPATSAACCCCKAMWSDHTTAVVSLVVQFGLHHLTQSSSRAVMLRWVHAYSNPTLESFTLGIECLRSCHTAGSQHHHCVIAQCRFSALRTLHYFRYSTCTWCSTSTVLSIGSLCWVVTDVVGQHSCVCGVWPHSHVCAVACQ